MIMSSEEIVNEISKLASEINRFINENVSGNPDELYLSSLHYIKSGGKRLRPFMAVKSSELFGGTVESALPAACAVELVHNFTLVHDDIMDNDNIRHNVSTVHRQFGIPLAILSGDVLFSKAFHLISSHGKKSGIDESNLLSMIELLSSACMDVCEGQALDIKMAEENNFSTKEQYIEMIGKKTAALFRVSCELGTLSSKDFNNNDLQNLSEYGERIGISFQLIDDLIGIHGDSRVTGKFVGNDIREGKKTLPILLAFENLDNQGKEQLTSVFGNSNSTNGDIEKVVEQISRINIDKEVREVADSYTQSAFDKLSAYDNSPAKSSLERSAKFIVERRL